MPNTMLLLTEEELTRIRVGLGEIPEKFATPVITEISTQIMHAEKAEQAFVKILEDHIKSIKDKVVTEVKDLVG